MRYRRVGLCPGSRRARAGGRAFVFLAFSLGTAGLALAASSPSPPDNAVGVSVGLESLTWDGECDDIGLPGFDPSAFFQFGRTDEWSIAVMMHQDVTVTSIGAIFRTGSANAMTVSVRAVTGTVRGNEILVDGTTLLSGEGFDLIQVPLSAPYTLTEGSVYDFAFSVDVGWGNAGDVAGDFYIYVNQTLNPDFGFDAGPFRVLDGGAWGPNDSGYVNLLMPQVEVCTSTFSVQFGTTPENMTELCAETGSNVCAITPGSLADGQAYSWRVDTTNADGTIEGDVWSFTTGFTCDIGVSAGPLSATNPIDLDTGPDFTALSVEVSDTANGQDLTYAWSANQGEFSNPALRTPIWTAPALCGGSVAEVEISVRITCPAGEFVDLSLTQQVIPVTPEAGITEGPTADPVQVACLDTVALSVLAVPNCGGINYLWTDNGAGGSFLDARSRITVWTPPINLTANPIVYRLSVSATPPGGDPAEEFVDVTVERCPTEDCILTMDDADGPPGAVITLPVNIEELPSGAPNDVAAFAFDVTYDTTILTFVGIDPDPAGTLSEDWDFLNANTTATGVVTVAGFTAGGGAPILQGDFGVLLRLQFEVTLVGQQGQVSLVCMQNLLDDMAGWQLDGMCCAGVQLACCRDGDVNQDGALTPADALLAFQHYLGLLDPALETCDQYHADVDNPQAPPTVTPADAGCIFEHFLDLPSCLDRTPFPQNCSEPQP